MSLTAGTFWSVAILVLWAAGMTAFAMWLGVRDERRQEKTAHEAFRKAFTIHQH